ncbi:hypothetical protein MKX03_013596, partial [Papaver bracteatum]
DDTSTVSRYSKWNEVTIKLPFRWLGIYGIPAYFHSVAGEDQIIIECHETTHRSKIQKVHLYSYDWKKKTTEKVKRGVLSNFASVSLFRSFVVSVWPVRDHQFKNPHCESKDDEAPSNKTALSNEVVHNQAKVPETTTIDSLKVEINNLEAGVKSWLSVEAKARSQMVEASAKARALEKTLATKKIELQAKEVKLAAGRR